MEKKRVEESTIDDMNVLLVEDSEMLRNVIKESLTECSQVAVSGVAATQLEAIALLDEQQFDMMVVDIELADGNGFEVIKHTLESNYPFKPPVAVMLTNHAYTHYRRSAHELGVNYFFDKSMEFDKAVETIISEADRFSATAT
jgi:DNA-binding NarL/FixJ family response regulator